MDSMAASSGVCDALLAKLDEVMSFLQFAKIPGAEFRGVVTFFFRSSQASDGDKIVCVRTVDMRRGIRVFTTALSASDPFASEAAPVHVSLADFLYMYSGEASASEIAGMCMSGRVSVPWGAYGKLKAFAECFDFSTEKWDAYYAYQAASGAVAATSLPQCSKPCCHSTTKEEIDANWCLVSDASTRTVHTHANGQMEEWEIVSDCNLHVLTPERREQIDETFGAGQLDEWLRKLCRGENVQKVHMNVKNTFNDFISLLSS
ncbi:hypothetical protein Poli38472_011472 [Pythium oligandrum]|uniref:Uncharacterized protein n=1 Tax=Pythium oligandrum TaxID=41045 RepID=A0A8K1FM82_PYTOL|nr:hypothetical protein Poli38472_011472 [Pythium oligandrum]|eukprot:TMW64592.1 hypothetical protein Poli38472_011472 [Pythium oligandrum]